MPVTNSSPEYPERQEEVSRRPLENVLVAVNVGHPPIAEQLVPVFPRPLSLSPDVEMPGSSAHPMPDPSNKCILCLSSLAVPPSPTSVTSVSVLHPVFGSIGEALSRAQADARAFQRRGAGERSEVEGHVGQSLPALNNATEQAALCPECHELCVRNQVQANVSPLPCDEEDANGDERTPGSGEDAVMLAQEERAAAIQSDVGPSASSALPSFPVAIISGQTSQPSTTRVRLQEEQQLRQPLFGSYPSTITLDPDHSLPSLIPSGIEIGRFKFERSISCIPATPPDFVTHDATPRGKGVPSNSTDETSSPVVTSTSQLPEESAEGETDFDAEEDYQVPNPLLDIGRLKVPSIGRGCLFPGSIFKGKQTSGRSSYEVEVRILDVSFPLSTLSGYLSISHLTESHPQLTTFFSGEIIGSTHGFLTGPSFYSAQATEQDDMRHWSRFENFRKVKGELKRPGLTMRDETGGGVGGAAEKSFCFMRWKERFLVPDHKVRDISGASFAGFYYLQLDLSPPPPSTSSRPTMSTRRSSQTASRPAPAVRRTSSTTTSPSNQLDPPSVTSGVGQRSPRSPTLPSSPIPRRGSSYRTSSSGAGAVKSGYPMPPQPLPVLTGYYFHHVHNSEPFQELSLTWVPPRTGSGSVQMR